MGLHGPQDRRKSERRLDLERSIAEPTITPEALAVYRKMRFRDHRYGPGGPEWWDLNARLADCCGLFAGMAVYEDPAWEPDPRRQQSAIDRFHQLERAAKAAGKEPKRRRYKWEK